jgi:hypothetical protein
MCLPSPNLALILAMLAAPSTAQRRRLSDQQAALMVDGAVSQMDVHHIGEEAMVESIIPTNASRPPMQPVIPITALLYGSSPGPRHCRGTPIFSLTIPKGAGLAIPQIPICYNVTLAPQAECGTFMANLEDGCQARTFGQQGCTGFTNIAVFMEELRPVGGLIRSIEIQCGIESAQPAPLALNLPPVPKPAGRPTGG